MSFEPATRRPVSELVFEQLRAAILAGRFASGEALPPERSLSESFEVNRHAVREALKRLQQAGLVEVNHGGATRVLDWRRTGGLDLLAHLPLAMGEAGSPEVLRAIVEARRCIGIDVVRLAAQRADADAIAELRLRGAAGAELGDDLDALTLRYEELWRTLVAAADNVAYALAYNGLLAATAAAHDASRDVFAAEARDLAAHAELVDAVCAADSQRAAGLADALLSRSLTSAMVPADA